MYHYVLVLTIECQVSKKINKSVATDEETSSGMNARNTGHQFRYECYEVLGYHFGMNVRTVMLDYQ
jgi:hypothetical protein